MVINYRYYLFTHDLSVTSSFALLLSPCLLTSVNSKRDDIRKCHVMQNQTSFIYKLKINIHVREIFILFCSFDRNFPTFSAFFQVMEFYTKVCFSLLKYEIDASASFRKIISRSLVCVKAKARLSFPLDVIIAWLVFNVLRLINSR